MTCVIFKRLADFIFGKEGALVNNNAAKIA